MFAEIDTMCLILLKSTISEKNDDVECIVGLPFRNKRLIFTIDGKMG